MLFCNVLEPMAGLLSYVAVEPMDQRLYVFTCFWTKVSKMWVRASGPRMSKQVACCEREVLSDEVQNG